MADQRTMAELLRAPIEGYAEAIVSKVRNSRNKPIVSQVKASNVDSLEIANAVTSAMTAMFKQHQVTPALASVKAVKESCVTCGGAHSYRQCPATNGNTFSGYQDNFQEYVSLAANTASSSGSGSLSSNIITNLRGDLKAITIQSGVSYDGPPIPPLFSSLLKVMEWVPEVTKDTVQSSIENIQPPVAQTQVPIDEPVFSPKPKPTIPYPSRANKQKLREKDDILAVNFVEIFRNLHFNLSFGDALLRIPKFALMFKSLLNNKEKLFNLATTQLVECLALADLGASINLMPLSTWKMLSLPELTPTRMILELADRSMTRPAGIAEDVFVKVGKFYFPTDFVVVDYVVDPRVSLILGRPFLSDAQSVNQIDVIDVACEEYVQEVLGFSKIPKNGNPTPTSNPIISFSSPLFTPFEGSYFILEEIETFYRTLDDLSNLDDDYYDTEGYILYHEKLLNKDPSLNLPPIKNDDLKQVDATMIKPSIEEPPKLELKKLPSHLEYAF
uniref:Reverse transcriptase domain-containing protein n=1 Tax=Tanacetum cinerariifolium TaxID=118510 RepID=A0A6L2N2C0_TANCI|nr:hypothetical protein [Tanacetum cinerariifolium]